MASGKNVFIVGPGLIGGTILDLLVAEGYNVTGFVRSEARAADIRKAGAQTVVGDLHDKASIAEQVVKHDIVLHTATADDLPSVEAVLDGVKQRASKGLQTIYIHTSGTSLLNDNAEGGYKSDKIYHDNKQDEIDSLGEDAPHRDVDLTILKARRELGEKAKIAIMIPPLIYGTTNGRLTIQLPTLARYAMKNGQPAHIGPGKSVWSNIHVRDLARGYATILAHYEKTPASDPSLANPYYFCEATGDAEPSWRDMASAIGEGLAKAGKVKSAEPVTMPKEKYAEVFGDFTPAVLGMNSRSRAVRLREMGWQPKEKGWRESLLEDELPAVMKEST